MPRSTPRRFTPRPLTLAVHAALICLLAAPAHALTEPTAPGQSYQLPAQPLASALRQFAIDYGITLVFEPELVKGKNAPPLRGALSVEQGLHQLLGYTSLELIQIDEKSYTLRPTLLTLLPAVEVTGIKPLARVASAGDVTLPAVEVNASEVAETATGPVKGYVAKRSSTATKTDTPIIETPQSISVVGAEEIKAIGATTVVEALAYTPGVINQAGFDPSTESFIFRGFQQWGNTLRDGLRYGGAWGWGGYQEVYGLERVELLKGAASVLYGAQSPGGVLNTVSKRPQRDLVQEIVAEYGSFDHKAIKADVGGALNDQWSWRLTSVLSDANTQVDYTENKRFYIAPSLQWQASPETSLTILPFYQKSELTRTDTLPYQGTIQPNPHGQFSRSIYVGEPGQDSAPNENMGLGLEFSHVFSEQTRLAAVARWNRNDATWNYTSFYGALEPDMRTIYRYATRDYQSIDNNYSADIHLEHQNQWAGVEHKLLLGADYLQERIHSKGGNWSNDHFAPIDLFNPVYGAQPDFSQGSFSDSHNLKNQNIGVYLQDQMSIGERWRLLLGARHAWVAQSNYATGSEQKDSKLTGNAGVVYLADYGLAPYASFSQSFQQEVGKLRDGGAMKPTEGEQFEAGVRWQPQGEQGLLVSLAAYQLTKSNVAKSDPIYPDFQIQVGEVRSRGIEFEAKGQLIRNLEGSLAYAYTDARTTESTAANEIGQRTAGVPYHQASAWLDYRFTALAIPELKIGAGVRYVGTQAIEGESFKVPASTQFDLRASYDWQHWQLNLNVTNLTDEISFSNCGWGRCGFTKARTVTGSVAYRF